MICEIVIFYGLNRWRQLMGVLSCTLRLCLRHKKPDRANALSGLLNIYKWL